MKKIFTAFLTVLSVHLLCGQITNSSFEIWDSTRCAQGPDIPEKWESRCSSPLFFFNGLRQTTDAYSGKYAAQLFPTITGDFAPIPIPTLLWTNLSVPIMPTSINGYYKYFNSKVNDSAFVRILIYEYDQAAGKYDTLLEKFMTLPVDSMYRKFAVDIPPVISGPEDDTMQIMFISEKIDPDSIFNILDADGVLFIDSLWFSFSPTAVSHIKNDRQIHLYPNPAANLLTISGYSDNEITMITIYDLFGKAVYRCKTSLAETALDISFLSTGIYIVVVSSREGKWTKKLIKYQSD